MKTIPFSWLNKRKYLWFMLVSFCGSVFVNFFVQLFSDAFSVQDFCHDIFFMWGFLYPVGFVTYKAAEKANRKESEQDVFLSWLEKHQYLFFMLCSLFMSFCLGVIVQYGDDGPYTFKSYLDGVFLLWGFLYPGCFIIYEGAKKAGEKEEE